MGISPRVVFIILHLVVEAMLSAVVELERDNSGEFKVANSLL